MSDQMAGFNARIKRIRDPRNTYYVDPETGAFVPKRVSKQQIKSAVARNKVDTPPTFFGLIWGIILGALVLMAARYVRYTQLGIGDSGTVADTLIMIDFGLAAATMFLLGGLIGQKSFKHMIAHVMGIAIMIVSMHNLVWMFPEQFGDIFTPAYVAEVQSITEPQTIWLRGESINIQL